MSDAPTETNTNAKKGEAEAESESPITVSPLANDLTAKRRPVKNVIRYLSLLFKGEHYGWRKTDCGLWGCRR